MNTDDEEADKLDDDERTTGLVQAAMRRPTQPAGIGSGAVMSTMREPPLEVASELEPAAARLAGEAAGDDLDCFSPPTKTTNSRPSRTGSPGIASRSSAPVNKFDMAQQFIIWHNKSPAAFRKEIASNATAALTALPSL